MNPRIHKDLVVVRGNTVEVTLERLENERIAVRAQVLFPIIEDGELVHTGLFYSEYDDSDRALAAYEATVNVLQNIRRL